MSAFVVLVLGLAPFYFLGRWMAYREAQLYREMLVDTLKYLELKRLGRL